jgi:hypothetical protein
MLFTDIFSEYFYHPRLKKKYVIKNNFYSYVNPILHCNNYILILKFFSR